MKSTTKLILTTLGFGFGIITTITCLTATFLFFMKLTNIEHVINNDYVELGDLKNCLLEKINDEGKEVVVLACPPDTFYIFMDKVIKLETYAKRVHSLADGSKVNK